MQGQNTHYVGLWMFPVLLKQMTHGPLIASVESAVTRTIQVEGVLIKSTFIHNVKGHSYLKGDEEVTEFESSAGNYQLQYGRDGAHVLVSCSSLIEIRKSYSDPSHSNLCSDHATSCKINIALKTTISALNQCATYTLA